MNNKVRGTAFERRVCQELADNGYWVHFITPDARGAQPFDIIAVKNTIARAIECKTLASNRRYFTIDRLEENQKMAFKKWKICGNNNRWIAVEWRGDIYIIRYERLEREGKIDMMEEIAYGRESRNVKQTC